MIMDLFGKRFSLLLFQLIFTGHAMLLAQQSPEEFFGDDYTQAVRTLNEQQAQLEQLCHLSGLDTLLVIPQVKEQVPAWRILAAIVFPELMRYSRFNDFFETTAIELAYIKGGKSAANFSIGHYQMRPSFIEDLESISQLYPYPQALQRAFRYPAKAGEQEKRSLRSSRLHQDLWQQYYLAAFVWVSAQRFPARSFASYNDMLRWYAACYNRGLHASPNQILQWQQRAAFPMGSKFKGPQFRYADVSVSYLDYIRAQLSLTD